MRLTLQMLHHGWDFLEVKSTNQLNAHFKVIYSQMQLK